MLSSQYTLIQYMITVPIIYFVNYEYTFEFFGYKLTYINNIRY